MKWNVTVYLSYCLFNSTMSRVVTRKLIEINYFLRGQYSANKNVRFQIPMPRSDLCDYIDAYVAFKGKVIVTGSNANKRINKKPIIKNNTRFALYTPRINNTFMDSGECLSIVMPMYNFVRICKQVNHSHIRQNITGITQNDNTILK